MFVVRRLILMKRILMLIVLAIMLTASGVQAAPQIIEASGEYEIGGHDTRENAKKIALENAMRNALEQVGVHVKTYSEVNNFKLTSDQIKTVSAGIIRVQERTIEYLEGGRLCVATITAVVDLDGDFRNFVANKFTAEPVKNNSPSDTRFNRFHAGYKYFVAQEVTDPEILHQLERAARVIDEDQDYEFAREILEAILERNDKIADAWAMLAICEGKIAETWINSNQSKARGIYKGEVPLWNSAIACEKNNATFYYYAGLAEINGWGVTSNSVLPYLNQAIKLNPDYLEAQILIGDFHYLAAERGKDSRYRYNQALQQYNKILVKYPDNADVLNRKAQVQQKLQKQ